MCSRKSNIFSYGPRRSLAKLLHAFDIAPLFINIGNCSGVIQFLHSVQTCFQIAEGF